MKHLIQIIILIYFQILSIELKTSFELKRIQTALLIIDMQDDYLEKQYTDYVPNTNNLSCAINKIRKKLRLQNGENLLEIFTVDCLLNNTLCQNNDEQILITDDLINRKNFLNTKRIKIDEGTEINELEELENLVPNLYNTKQIILEKSYDRTEYSAFGQTIDHQNRYGKKPWALVHKILQARNIKRVYVVGLEYQYCVLYTAADAAYLGYETFMIQNGSQSAVLTIDKYGKSIPDNKLVHNQYYETNKVLTLVSNKLNGLPGKNGEILKVVEFDGNKLINLNGI